MSEVPVIKVFRKDMFIRCWIASRPYATMGCFSIHKGIDGPGEVTRHLCCNSKCINPMHMKRGTQGENRHDDAVKNRWKKYTFDRVVTEHISGKCPDLSVLDDLNQSYADHVAYKMKDLRDSLEYNQFKYAKQLWKAILEYRQLEIMED